MSGLPSKPAKRSSTRLEFFSPQTVPKHNLHLTGVAERVSPQNKALRSTAVVGDVRSIVAANTASYERSGQSTVDMLSQIDKHPTLAETCTRGRKAFRDRVTEVFEPQLLEVPESRRETLLRLLMVQLDVYTSYQLRILDGHSQQQVQNDLTFAIEALLAK